MPVAKLHDFLVEFNNSEEYHHLKQEIFTHNAYYFETDTPQPRIIDAGAHIGLATLYFKRLYPQAIITAIEPFPENFHLLEKNIWENQLTDIRIIQAALAEQASEATFYFDASDEHWWSTAGFHQGAWTGSQQSQEITLSTRPLAEFLTEPIDFLKLDIEGAEQAVLMAAGDLIKQVKHAIIEFHTTPNQSLPKLVEWLEQKSFVVELTKDNKPVTRPDKVTGLVQIEAIAAHH